MVIGMQNEIPIGIKKLPLYVSFQTMDTLNRTAETRITQSTRAFYPLNLLILELFYDKLRITYSYPTRSKTNSREGQIELQFVFLAFECRYRAHSHVHRDNVYRTYAETMCIPRIEIQVFCVFARMQRPRERFAQTQRKCERRHTDSRY